MKKFILKKIASLALTATMTLAAAFPAMAKTNPTNILKDGGFYSNIENYQSNSSQNKGIMKVSENKSYNIITLGDEEVGYFYFDKKADSIDIYLTKDVTVDVEWHCSKYYANATLEGIGKYSLPQLMLDNGKYQSFDQIWIISAEYQDLGSFDFLNDKSPEVVSYERYLAYVEIWNDLYQGKNADLTSSTQKDMLRDMGGLAHYFALVDMYGGNPEPYFHFGSDMQDFYDTWADALEVGLLAVCTQLGIDLQTYVMSHSSNI